MTATTTATATAAAADGTGGGVTSTTDDGTSTETVETTETGSSATTGTTGETSGETRGETTGETSESGDTGPVEPLETDVRNYIFGHSLILHSPTANVPIWLDALAQEAGQSYGMSGQYGFADTHAADLPPNAQWGIEGVTGLWDEDNGDVFADIDFNTVLFTEANFRQYYPPTESDPDNILPESSVASTLKVFDWVAAAEPGVRYMIYENWPDMGGYTDADFEGTFPTDAELQTYHGYTQGELHNWWLAYQDGMIAERPELNVRMVPVGSVMAKLLTTTLSEVPASELYEDNAPHGRPTLYFLAGLVTYMGVYGVPAPADYVVPDSIHQEVRDLYPEIVESIWDELLNFTDGRGQSRVF